MKGAIYSCRESTYFRHRGGRIFVRPIRTVNAIKSAGGFFVLWETLKHKSQVCFVHSIEQIYG